MKILLIFPKAKYAASSKKKDKEPFNKFIGEAVSLTLPQVAASTPSGHSIEIIDENYEPIDFNADADLVGITCITMTVNRAYEIADMFHMRGIPVVIGGDHPSALPTEAKQHADSVVVGEAEDTWPLLLEDFTQNRLKPFYVSTGNVPSELINEPRRDLIKRRYVGDGLLMRRGCPNQCEFCAVTTLHHKEERPLEKVFEEIQHISARKIFIYDQNLTWNMEYAKRFLQGLPGINKRWLANGTANMIGKDDEFLGLAKDAHLFCWFVGFESISQKSLNGAKKKTNKSEEFASVIQKVRSYGMILVGSFIFGFDEDTPDLFDDTLQAISDWGLEMAEFHILTPFPGTALYKRLKVDGRLLTEDWSKYTTTNVVFEPKNMSAKELYEGTRRVAKEYHSIPRIMKRSYNILETTKNPSLAYYVFQRNLRYRERYANQFNF